DGQGVILAVADHAVRVLEVLDRGALERPRLGDLRERIRVGERRRAIAGVLLRLQRDVRDLRSALGAAEQERSRPEPGVDEGHASSLSVGLETETVATTWIAGSGCERDEPAQVVGV